MLRLSSLIPRLAGDERGSVITTFALAAPVIAILTLGAVDLASVSADKNTVQDVADSAALMAAKQLGMADNAGLAERTKAIIAEQLAVMNSRLTYQTTVLADTAEGTVGVRIVANRTSFFVNMLPPGGWNFTVLANAQQMGNMPLCVLSSGGDKNDEVSLEDTSHVAAPGCMVHSNADITVKNSAILSAGVVQSSGLATGAISPAAQTDAPAIPDPFSGMTIGDKGALCSPLDLLPKLGVMILAPGIHCGNIMTDTGGEILLLPGEHYFQKGKLELKSNARLTGDDVVLIFGKDADFKFTDQSQIRLKGRRSGAYAGFVIATTRENTHEFEISSSAARELLGTVYVPNATLMVKGKNRIADQSAWTVIVAKGIHLKENPDLVINKNYSGTSVPVPQGVGDKASNSQVRLSH